MLSVISGLHATADRCRAASHRRGDVGGDVLAEASKLYAAGARLIGGKLCAVIDRGVERVDSRE